jgi:hypothetical protein
MTTEELAQDWNAHKLMLMGQIAELQAQVKSLQDQTAVIPLLSNNLSELHDRVVTAEEANKDMQDHHDGSKNRTIGAVAVSAAGVGGISNLDWIVDILSKLGGG